MVFDCLKLIVDPNYYVFLLSGAIQDFVIMSSSARNNLPKILCILDVIGMVLACSKMQINHLILVLHLISCWIHTQKVHKIILHTNHFNNMLKFGADVIVHIRLDSRKQQEKMEKQPNPTKVWENEWTTALFSVCTPHQVIITIIYFVGAKIKRHYSVALLAQELLEVHNCLDSTPTKCFMFYTLWERMWFRDFCTIFMFGT